MKDSKDLYAVSEDGQVTLLTYGYKNIIQAETYEDDNYYRYVREYLVVRSSVFGSMGIVVLFLFLDLVLIFPCIGQGMRIFEAREAELEEKLEYIWNTIQQIKEQRENLIKAKEAEEERIIAAVGREKLQQVEKIIKNEWKCPYCGYINKMPKHRSQKKKMRTPDQVNTCVKCGAPKPMYDDIVVVEVKEEPAS